MVSSSATANFAWNSPGCWGLLAKIQEIFLAEQGNQRLKVSNWAASVGDIRVQVGLARQNWKMEYRSRLSRHYCLSCWTRDGMGALSRLTGSIFAFYSETKSLI